MTFQPDISIVLPVYNGQRYLDLAIQSCLNQSFENFELIIVDDFSTDGSLAIAQSYKEKDKRIKIIRNKKNLNLPASLNVGHRSARGKFMTWTSDDNIYHKDALYQLLEVLKGSNADVVYSDYNVIDEEGSVIGQTTLKPIEYLLFTGVIGACFLYRKEVYFRNSGYREDLFLIEDWDFWLRAIKHSNFKRIKKPELYFYRYHPTSLTTKMKTDSLLRENFLENMEIVYKDLFKDMMIRNKQALTKFIFNWFLKGPSSTIDVIVSKDLFRDLETVAGYLTGFSPSRLKYFMLQEVTEAILKNKKYQTPGVLILLHRRAHVSLFQLPVKRYFALVKKCMF